MAHYGSPFDADIKNGRIEGKGKFTFPDGNVYVGHFKDGEFHGKGTIFFKNGGKYMAEWDNGHDINGLFTFEDGLIYDENDWDYCTEKDRRFYSERCNGIPPAGISQLCNNVEGAPNIPQGCYDCGDGYYNPKSNRIFTYTGLHLRNPDEEEVKWIIEKCRIGVGKPNQEIK
ncbi:MORN repeat-containing protein 5 [Neocallimastix lanati (nom. inval.)]|jgi:hypothetical protein|uniref:MORN repeat-containing protein 5 n=1 Tax=Neocallimastix californiae TaxID=1754190 RepID=A0A1Y2F8E0_9FUNG|nr:MORN repeat-containing protein 5 [Neocallimastix sp. JGI-2020a]ORY80172.1 MORN repeat-containing protein 5 [Neocallimastix californiae]|eukprot:ORY80172.1 MORN repeat-containing protein 5 [Neocallimastix californiae]